MAKSSLVNFKVLIYGVIIFMTSFQTVFLPNNEENVLGIHVRRTAPGHMRAGPNSSHYYHHGTLLLEECADSICVFPFSKLVVKDPTTAKRTPSF